MTTIPYTILTSHLPKIVVGGLVGEHVLIENANSESEEGLPIVRPPLDSILDTSSYLSFSFYNSRGVIISNEHFRITL